jgi:cyclopropane fatty-acyl-phospholipid synthase-like methyltransferase
MSQIPSMFDDPAGHWDARYAADGFVFGDAPNVTLVEQSALFRKGDRVLCVADGEGRNSAWLAARGCVVTGFDVSPAGVAKARRLAAQRNVAVDLEVASVTDWQWDAQAWDAVVAIFVQFADPLTRSAMFEGFHRAVRSGGVLLLVGYGPRQLEFRTGGPGKLEHLYTEAMLREAFAGWDIEHLVRTERMLHEGSGHDGRSDVLELVARRR